MSISTAVTKAAPSMPGMAMSEEELAQVLTTSLYPGAAIPSIKMVLSYCKAAGLDPMQKPVHIVPMWDKNTKQMRDVVMPGIGLYRTQAVRSGAYAGVTEPEFGEDVTEELGGVKITYPRWCAVSVKRVLPGGQTVEFSAKEFWKENYAPAGKDTAAPNAMWRKRPYGQINKCAEAQALRKAFPELGAAPTADEMEGKEFEEREINPSPVNHAPLIMPPYPEDKFLLNLAAWRASIASGKSTADRIIAMVQTKGPLTEDQKAAIRNTPSASAEDGSAQVPAGSDGAASPGISFAQVEAKIRAAEDADLLSIAADLIGEVSDPKQRAELTEIYKQRIADLNE